MIKFIKRIHNYDNQDWKHVTFLFKNMIKQFLLMDYKESKEAYLFLKTHLMYDSTRVK